MALVENLAVRELTADEVRELVVLYRGQQAHPQLPTWTKESLAIKFLTDAPEGSTYFVLEWYGYSTPHDVGVGGVIILQTRDNQLQARRGTSMPGIVGRYVRLEGKGFEGYDQHKVLIFLHPPARIKDDA